MKLTALFKDLELGERNKVKELCQLVRDDSAYQNLTMEEEDKMKQDVLELCEQDVLELCEQKKVGARPTNKSAAQDYCAQMTQMNNEAHHSLITPF